MLRLHQEQVARVDRLLRLVTASDQQAALGDALTFEDVLFFTFQAMWHIKDWVLNDPYFEEADRPALEREIYQNPFLQVCADLANGSKHLSLTKPKTSVRESGVGGIRVQFQVFQLLYYLESPDPGSQFHGMEIREFLTECRSQWGVIIDRHYKAAWTAPATD